MIKVENVEVFNFEGALRGCRNPLESWDKSDSGLGCDEEFCDCCSERFKGCYSHNYQIGENDLGLAQKLIKAGSDHSKFMRQIMVSVDLTLPLYVWKEFDTYKVGTVANSCSTMHKLATTPITKECFSFDSVIEDYECYKCGKTKPLQDVIVGLLENYRLEYLRTKDVRIWRALIQLLPESWNQMRTVTLNYAVLRNMYFARRNHKLSEWVEFCKWIETELPYGKQLICYE